MTISAWHRDSCGSGPREAPEATTGSRASSPIWGTQEFPRVRVGVGEKPPRMDLADYVLGHFSQGEGKIMEDAVKEAADAVMEAVEEGIDHAMNSHNRKKDGQA